MNLTSLKPAAPVWGHLFLAALTWSVVGGVLFALGATWTLAWSSSWRIPLLAFAVVLGVVKAWVIMRPVAARTVTRIRARGDGRCLGGFQGWASWLLVLVMIALGRFLRGSGLPLHWVGLLYAWVGTALLAGSLVPWRAFAATRRKRRA